MPVKWVGQCQLHLLQAGKQNHAEYASEKWFDASLSTDGWKQ